MVKDFHICIRFQKLHKQSTGSRFIIAALKYSVEPFFNVLTSILRLFFRKIKGCHDKCIFFSGIKSLRTIFNNHPGDRCCQQN